MKRLCLYIFVMMSCISIPSLISAQMTWTCTTDSAGWVGRGFHTAVVYDNKMWVLGGALIYPPWPTPLNDAWSSSDGINWTQVTMNAPWAARWGHTSVVFDGKMWVMGGVGDSGYVNDVWCSTDGIDWTQATANAEWSARCFHASIVFNNMIWVIGGVCYGGLRMNDVWYSPDGVNWTQATPNAQWTARSGHTSVVFDNKMWVLGGQVGDNSYINDVWYSLNGVNWIHVPPHLGWLARGYHTSVIFDGKMWVMGGVDGYSSTNDVWYSPDSINWTQATPNAQWTERYSHASVVFDNKMWIMGGGRSDDVWYSFGLGIEEDTVLTAKDHYLRSTIFRGPLQMPTGKYLRVFDITGRVVEPTLIKPGIYFIEVDGKVTQKVIKMR